MSHPTALKKFIALLFLCLLAAPLSARSSYPPTLEDARVETYRRIDSTELKLWIFGSDDRPHAMILFNPACTLASIPLGGASPGSSVSSDLAYR